MASNKNLKYAFYGSLVVIIIGCFFTYFTAMGISMNYVSYNGNLKDGVFVIGLSVAAAICLFKDKNIPALICQLLATVLFVYDFIDTNNKIKDINSTLALFGTEAKFGIGFYIVLIGLIVSLVTLILKIKNGNKNNN